MTSDPNSGSGAAEAERINRVYRQYESSCHNSRWSPRNPANLVVLEEIRATELDLLRRHRCLPDRSTKALDFGCGSGAWLDWLCKLGGRGDNFYGVDIRSEVVARTAKDHPHLNISLAGDAGLPFPDGFFDFIQMHVVLSSILDSSFRIQVCKELDRVLGRAGAILIYDFRINNPRNPNVRGVSRKAISVLFPGYRFHFHSLSVFPPLSRRLGSWCGLFYPALKLFPFLRTHNMGLGRKKQDPEIGDTAPSR
jgi:SAM-dependent methyltransferase